MSFNRGSDRERKTNITKQSVLVAVQPSSIDDAAVQRSLDELEQLAAGLGMKTVARLVQPRVAPTPSTYIGEGKLVELAKLTGGTGTVARGPDSASPSPLRDDLVVIADDELSARQTRNLERALGVRVLDRTHVILHIFETRAQTNEARLEVEMATLEYQLPRIRDDQSLGDREGGGGRASRGHSNVELAKQRTRQRLATLRKKLEHEHAIQARRRHARSETFRVALVGYTNAGKSSLMRSLTGSDVLIEDKLFATLGTTIRPLVPPTVPPILLVDTVGFIDKLPHGLIASFQATLSEVHEAWLLLQVVDASDPSFRAQLDVTRRVLKELGAGDTPTWTILNKIDRVSIEDQVKLEAEFATAAKICSFDRDHAALLRARLEGFFDAQLVEAHLTLPYSKHGVLAAARSHVRVLSEVFGEVIEATVAGAPAIIEKLERDLV